MAFTIRARSQKDIPELASVLVRVYALDGYPVEGVSDPERWLQHPNELQSWTADKDGRPVGQVTLSRATPDDDAARVWLQQTGADVEHLAIPVRLFVDPEYRGSGVGQHLMETAVSFAQERDLAVAFDVMLKDHTAIRLYERLGAKRLAEISHRYGSEHTEPAAVYVLPQQFT